MNANKQTFLWFLVIAVIIISASIVVFTATSSPKQARSSSCSSTGVQNVCAAAKDGKNPLLPVHEPLFNVKEIIKQMILLEDHLFEVEKRCVECIYKHLLAIESFSEEGITLDKTAKYYDLFHEVLVKVRQWEKQIGHKKYEEVAHQVRDLRKKLMQTPGVYTV